MSCIGLIYSVIIGECLCDACPVEARGEGLVNIGSVAACCGAISDMYKNFDAKLLVKTDLLQSLKMGVIV